MFIRYSYYHYYHYYYLGFPWTTGSLRGPEAWLAKRDAWIGGAPRHGASLGKSCAWPGRMPGQERAGPPRKIMITIIRTVIIIIDSNHINDKNTDG